MTSFADLFTYRTLTVKQYPSHKTLRFDHVQLTRDVEVRLGSRVVATIKQGTLLESAVWLPGSPLELKCSLNERHALATQPDSYTELLNALSATK